jgi:hypothetical protein
MKDTLIKQVFSNFITDDTQNIFTPPSLCREMLSHIKFKGNEKVLVLYNLEFALILNQEFGLPTSSIYIYTDSKIKQIFSKYGFNILYFEDTLGLNKVDMKFDIVVGNPPYNEGKAGVNKSIYQKFIQMYLDSNSQYGLFVTPGGFMDSNKKEYKIFRKKLKNSGLKIINSAQKYFPNQTIQDCIYYLIDKQYTGDYTLYGSIVKNDLSESLIKIRDKKDDIYDKLNDSSFPAIRGGVTLYKSNKDKYKEIPIGNFNKPFICNNTKEGFEVIYVEDSNHRPYIKEGKSMVIFNERWNKKELKLTNIQFIPDASQYSFNCNILAIEVKDKNEGDLVISYLNSKLFRFLLGSAKSSGQALVVGKLRKLPHWNNKFNLTQEEIDLIELTIK